ncbi:MAG: hypothetical protein JWQ09_4080 [Segetibacter sp.]|nr:hypothetical protein [Segetibacter sp.]
MNPSSQVTFVENEITAVIKTNGESNAKRSNHGGNVRAYGKIAKMHDTILLEPVFENTKEKNIKKRICASTGGIPEGLQRHKLSKQGIEKINNAQNKIVHQACLTKWAAKISVVNCTFAAQTVKKNECCF